MKKVRTQQRYRCDHKPCKKVLIKHAMEKHESKCYFNPDRKCTDIDCVDGIIPAVYNQNAEVECHSCEIWKKIQKELN